MGQVVYLSAGTYNLGSTRLNPKSGVTVRGAGRARQSSTAAQQNLFRYDGNPFIGILRYNSGQRIHGWLDFDCLVFSSVVLLCGRPPYSNHREFEPEQVRYGHRRLCPGRLTSAAPSLDAQRCFRYISRITSVVGNTVTFATPIPVSFSASLNPKAYAQNGSYLLTQFGIENMTFYGCADPILYYASDRCWFLRLEFSNCPSCDLGHIQMHDGFQA